MMHCKEIYKAAENLWQNVYKLYNKQMEQICEVNNIFSSRIVQKCYLQSTLSHVERSYISYNGKLHLFHV